MSTKVVVKKKIKNATTEGLLYKHTNEETTYQTIYIYKQLIL